MRRFLAISALVLLAPGVGFAQDVRPPYSLKQDEPPTGSNIRREDLHAWLPMDKRYEELTPEQQAAVKAQYEHMGPLDEPPFPVDGLRRIFKAVNAAEQKLRVTGPLSVFVDVDSDGKPLAVSVYRSPDPRMTQAVATTPRGRLHRRLRRLFAYSSTAAIPPAMNALRMKPLRL